MYKGRVWETGIMRLLKISVWYRRFEGEDYSMLCEMVPHYVGIIPIGRGTREHHAMLTSDNWAVILTFSLSGGQ